MTERYAVEGVHRRGDARQRGYTVRGVHVKEGTIMGNKVDGVHVRGYPVEGVRGREGTRGRGDTQ